MTVRGDTVRQEWNQTKVDNAMDITLGIDYTIMAGCPVSLLIGSCVMKRFKNN